MLLMLFQNVLAHRLNSVDHFALIFLLPLSFPIVMKSRLLKLGGHSVIFAQ